MINWSGCALRVSPYSPLQSPYGIILSAVMDMTQIPAILKCAACPADGLIKNFLKSQGFQKIVFFVHYMRCAWLKKSRLDKIKNTLARGFKKQYFTLTKKWVFSL